MDLNDIAYELDEAVRDRLIAIVGREHSLVERVERDEYRDPFWYVDDRRYDSSLVLFPGSVEQVQELTRLASELNVPLWVSSQGRNNGYGGPSARVAGSVLVSLRRMNRVLEIDADLQYAVVEPGVTWFDLRAALDDAGHADLWFSIPDLGWGSIVGNSLDNGLTYGPYGADFQKICGMEVVLADGEVLRTGTGGLPNSRTWHLYPRGLGPVLDPLFIQSNYGTVVRMGIWLMRRPESYAPLFLSVARDDQFEEAVDILRELRFDGVIRGVPNIQNTVTMGAHFAETRNRFLRSEPALSEVEIDELAVNSGLGRWGVRTALWGDRPVVEHQLSRIRQAWGRLEGSSVLSERIYADDEWDQIDSFIGKVQAGIPSLDIIERTPAHIGHVDFSPIVPLAGSELRAVTTRIRDFFIERTGKNFVCAIFVINERSCVVVTSINFDVNDARDSEEAFATVRELAAEMGERGYLEYRAHIDVSDTVAQQLSFGGGAYARFTSAIKDAVDPRGILSPGRHGVWPTAPSWARTHETPASDLAD